MFNLAGMGFIPPLLRTEAPLLGADGLPLSASGGGVGGKSLRPSGGSDCCLLLCRPGFTRFVAANERFSAGRSSFTLSLPAYRSQQVRSPLIIRTYILDLRTSKASKGIGPI